MNWVTVCAVAWFVFALIYYRWPIIYRTPKTGEVWVLKTVKRDPWDERGEVPAVIRDVKDGWVRYSFGASGLFSDERETIHWFVQLYRLKEEGHA